MKWVASALHRSMGVGGAAVFVLALVWGYCGPVYATAISSPSSQQDVFYKVSVDQSRVELTLVSCSDLPFIRKDVLTHREGFVLHLSHRVNLRLESFGQVGPLVVLPVNEVIGTAVVVLAPGFSDVVQADAGATRARFIITVDPEQMEKYFVRKGAREGAIRAARNKSTAEGLPERPASSDFRTDENKKVVASHAVLPANPAGSALGSAEYVSIRGRVITAASMEQLIQLPKVTPQWPLSTYLASAINPPGSDVVYRPGTTLAGGAADHDPFLGYKLGPGSFRPYVSFIYEHDSNLLGKNTDTTSADTFTLSPIVEYEILGRTHDLRIAYNPVFRWLRNFNEPSRLSHFVNFDSRVEVNDRLRLALRDHFARGIFEAREFDAGRELSFSSEPFYRNDVGVEVSFDVSEKNQLIGDVDFNRLIFDVRSNSTFFNFDTYSYSLGWLREQWITADYFFRYRHTQNITSGTNAAGRGGSSDDYEFGINKTLTDRTSSNLTLGYRNTQFDNEGLSNFHSWTARASISKQFNDRNSLEIAANRTSSPSAFGTGRFANSFFVNKGVTAHFQRLGERFQLGFSGGFQRNLYPETTQLTSLIGGVPFITLAPRRRDNLYDIGADFGWIVGNKMLLDIGYAFENRSSNLGDGFNFRRHTIRISFNLGRVSSGSGEQGYTQQSVGGPQQ